LRAQIKTVIDGSGGTEGQQNLSSGVQTWLRVADRAMSAAVSLPVQVAQMYIYQQPYPAGGPSRENIITRTKSQVGLPMECDFDALMYKVLPRGVSYMYMRRPELHGVLSPVDIGVLNEAEKKMK
jgi:hypothetical protein